MSAEILNVLVYSLWGACFLIGGILITNGIANEDDPVEFAEYMQGEEPARSDDIDGQSLRFPAA